MNTFTIHKIINANTVEVSFSVDNKHQIITNVPTGDVDAVTAYFSDMAKAYTAGIELEKATIVENKNIPEEVKAIIGKPQEVVVEAVEEPVINEPVILDPVPVDPVVEEVKEVVEEAVDVATTDASEEVK